MDSKTVFRFHVYFESDKACIQQRFVVADSEEEAIEKIEKYSDDLVAKGFDRLIWLGCAPTVELEYVID